MNVTYLHSLPRQLGNRTFIVWFLLACAEQEQIIPVSRQWLLDHMPEQTSPGCITDALRYLCGAEVQLAVRVTGGWRLASAIQLPLVVEPVETELSTPYPQPKSQMSAERIFQPGSSSSAIEESKESLLDPLLLPDQMSAERTFQFSAKSTKDRQACKAACLTAGIHDPTATQISALIWVTPNYILDHVAEVKRQGRDIGLAIWRMKNQWTAPVDKSDGRRYAEGEYAEYINR